ncbi:MAG: hypothetical protein Q9185_003195 [Variospora sp. 1 TL-2023]
MSSSPIDQSLLHKWCPNVFDEEVFDNAPHPLFEGQPPNNQPSISQPTAPFDRLSLPVPGDSSPFNIHATTMAMHDVSESMLASAPVGPSRNNDIATTSVPHSAAADPFIGNAQSHQLHPEVPVTGRYYQWSNTPADPYNSSPFQAPSDKTLQPPEAFGNFHKYPLPTFGKLPLLELRPRSSGDYAAPLYPPLSMPVAPAAIGHKFQHQPMMTPMNSAPPYYHSPLPSAGAPQNFMERGAPMNETPTPPSVRPATQHPATRRRYRTSKLSNGSLRTAEIKRRRGRDGTPVRWAKRQMEHLGQQYYQIMAPHTDMQQNPDWDPKFHAFDRSGEMWRHFYERVKKMYFSATEETVTKNLRFLHFDRNALEATTLGYWEGP